MFNFLTQFYRNIDITCARFRTEISYLFFRCHLDLCKWNWMRPRALSYELNGSLLAVSIALTNLSLISEKYSLNLSAMDFAPATSTPSWTKDDVKSGWKVFLLIISFNVSHVFRISFLPEASFIINFGFDFFFEIFIINIGISREIGI